MQNEREFASAIIILYMHCNKIEEFMEICNNRLGKHKRNYTRGSSLNHVACHGGRGVCQMIILLYKLYSGHLVGGGQNSQKMATWFMDVPYQHIITCSCIQFLPTFMNNKYHQNEFVSQYKK